MTGVVAELEDPAAAVSRLLARISPIGTEEVARRDVRGRVGAAEVVTDRPSPPFDASAMDGYAVRLADLGAGTLAVAAEVAAGNPPPSLGPGTTVRIFTGGAVPEGAEAVIPRELVEELPGEIRIPAGLVVKSGQHIRLAGENGAAGEVVIEAGAVIGPAQLGAMASFGVGRPRVYERVKVGILTTGSELVGAERMPTPYQVRDSNGPTIQGMLAAHPWISVVAVERVGDDADATADTITRLGDLCHAVFLSGGVSMGDYDFVPGVLERVGADIVFHRTAQRPGKPMLGAVGPGGETIIGLPGNPVSVAITLRRFGLVVLRRLGGLTVIDPPPPVVTLDEVDGATAPVLWHRLVVLTGPGRAGLVPSRGSGDLVSAARSDGFVAIPAGGDSTGPWPFYAWHV